MMTPQERQRRYHAIIESHDTVIAALHLSEQHIVDTIAMIHSANTDLGHALESAMATIQAHMRVTEAALAAVRESRILLNDEDQG